MNPDLLTAEQRLHIVQEAYGCGQKRSKYRNQRCDCGHKHASRKECARWRELVLLERAGQIRNLHQQVPFLLVEPVMLDGRRKPALRYIADWTYEERCVPDVGCWHPIAEDCKSPVTRCTAIYRAKRHLMKAVHDIEVKET